MLKNKSLKLILFISLFALAYPILSLLMYWKLINEVTAVTDVQCLEVNPIVIERKNHYINSLEAATEGNGGVFESEYLSYFETSKQYVEAQENWINSQFALMNRWDFKLFMPSYIQKAAYLQYTSRMADKNSVEFLIESFEEYPEDPVEAKELGDMSNEQVEIRNMADEMYNDLWESDIKLDWRARLIKTPASKCPEENLDIPSLDIFNEPIPIIDSSIVG